MELFNAGIGANVISTQSPSYEKSGTPAALDIVADRIFEVLAQTCSGLARKTKEAEKKSPRWRDESVLKADYGY